jgi:hypothetical protein
MQRVRGSQPRPSSGRSQDPTHPATRP